MGLLIPFRCIICTLYHKQKDTIIYAERLQAKTHINYQHSYDEKLRTARHIYLIKEYERCWAKWLTNQLVELSIITESEISLSQTTLSMIP